MLRNMFLHRYSWLFSLVVIYMAAETLNRWKDVKLMNVAISFTFAQSRIHYELYSEKTL